jgi:uncharacterized protein (TIGR00369 family)
LRSNAARPQRRRPCARDAPVDPEGGTSLSNLERPAERALDGGELPPEEAAAIQARLARIPIFRALSFSDFHLRRGEVSCSVPWLHEYDGIFESFHGGLLMTIADSAAAVAVLTLVGADERIATTDMSIRFLAPVRSAARVTAKVLKLGRTLVPIEARVLDDRDRLAAVCQVTYIRVPVEAK